MEIGLYSFGERTPEPGTGHVPSPSERLQRLLDEIELADQVGLDVFGVGEHHRPDYAVSAPVVVLAAAAARTARIRLTSAVTVLSSDDPVRVFQQFATLDVLSAGRAEIMVGRGSFLESFPLFGYDLADYDALFEEKLALLLHLRERALPDWPGGRFTRPLRGLGVHPRPVQQPMPVWIAVGGTPSSAVRAGRLGLPMALAIIGGLPERFVPFVELYRQAAREAGHTPRLSLNLHGFVADTSQAARRLAFAAMKTQMDKIGRERGWPPLSPAVFEAGCSLRGAYVVGSPAEVVEKLLYHREMFAHERVLLQLTVGSLPHADVRRAIELLGTAVAPAVRRALASATATTTA